MNTGNRDNNRLHINFQGGQGHNVSGAENNQTYPATNAHVYPTTPSTFPQPVFSPVQQQHHAPQDYLSANFQQQQRNYNASAPGGYFGGAAPQQQHQQQQQQQYTQQQYGQQAHYTTGQSFAPQPVGAPNYAQRQFHQTDPTSSLARQFSNQNLGTAQQRGQSPFGRQPSPLGPPPTGRTPPLQPGGAYGGAGGMLQPGPSGGDVQMQQQPQDEVPPEVNASKYSSNVVKRVIGLHVQVEAFFKDNITRARERNQR